jgi:uncharacterized protein YndB with AHSA1/START domain
MGAQSMGQSMGKGSESFAIQVISQAPPERVFALLADGANWAAWAGPMVPASRWERKGTPPPGGVGAVRALGRFPLVDLEEILESDPPRRHAYTITSGIPVRDYLGVVELNLTAEGGTRIDWSASFNPKIPGTGRLLRAVSQYIVTSIATHLADAALTRP